MMIITFSPMRHDDTLSLSKSGDVLTVNGQAFDFSALPEGASLSCADIESVWFAGPVERRQGDLHIRLFLPHGPSAPEDTRFPAALACDTDGPVPVPVHSQPDTDDADDLYASA